MLVVLPSDDREWHWAAVTSEQIVSTASPAQPIREVLGNFEDLRRLIEEVEKPLAPIELGKPLPQDKYIPRSRIGSCPAAHNRALLDDRLSPDSSRTSGARRARR